MIRVVVLCALLAACGNRKDECGKWRLEFNRVVEKVMHSGTVNGAADAKGAIAQMAEVSAGLAAIQIDDDTLKGFQKEYIDIAAKKVSNMEAAKTAADKGDQAAWDAASRRADANDAEEDAVTQRVVDYCR